MEFAQWKQLSASQQEALRRAIHFVMDVAGEKMTLDEGAIEGVLSSEDQDGVDEEFLFYLNEELHSDVTELGLRYFSVLIGTDDHKEAAALVADVRENTAEWNSVFGGMLAPDFEHRLISVLGKNIKGLEEAERMQRHLARDSAAVERSILSVVVPQLLREQANLRMRLDADISGEPNVLLDRLEEIQINPLGYDAQNPHDRMIMAELFNVFAQQQRDLTSPIGKMLMQRFRDAYPEPREILAILKLSPDKVEGTVDLGSVKEAIVNTRDVDLGDPALQTSERPQALGDLRHTHRHPSIDAYVRGGISLIDVVRTIQQTHVSRGALLKDTIAGVLGQQHDDESEDIEREEIMIDAGLADEDDFDKVEYWNSIVKGSLIDSDTVAAIQTLIDTGFFPTDSLDAELNLAVAEMILEMRSEVQTERSEVSSAPEGRVVIFDPSRRRRPLR